MTSSSSPMDSFSKTREKMTIKKKQPRNVRYQSKAESINGKFESLPDELITNILSRVPTLELPNLRYVCKRWRDVVKVKNPYIFHLSSYMSPFRTLHLSHSLSNPTGNTVLLLRTVSGFHFVDLESRREITIETRRNLPLPISRCDEIIGSCNGFLSLGSKEYCDALVINPVTNEFVHLNISGPITSWGFGFDFVKNIFKVVVLVWDVPYLEPELRICDLYSCKKWDWNWRCISLKETFRYDFNLWSEETLSYDFKLWSESPACFFNGKLHWIYKNDRSANIISFDLADEEFRSVPIPDCLRRRKFDLFVLRGCLSIIRYQASATPRLEIWVMKQYGVKESWVKEVDTKPLIPKSLPPYFDKSLKRRWRITLKGLGSVRDGEVLLRCKRSEYEEAILFSSDPACEQLQFLEFESKIHPNGFESRIHPNGSVIHMASLNRV